MEKVLIACYGKYLRNTGIENVLFEYVKLGPGVVKSAHNGGKYVLEKHAVMIIDEMLQRIQFNEFFEDKNVDQNASQSIEQFQEIFKSLY